MSNPPLTLHRTIEPGDLVRQGAMAPYRSLAHGSGEPHLVRDDLAPAERWAHVPAGGGTVRSLLTLLHLTDLQLADVQSPARFEFFNRELGDPRFAKLVPTQRPYEAFLPVTVAQMVATVNRLAVGPFGGGAVDLAVSTGDAIDNGQWNELQAVLGLLEGGPVRPSGDGTYRGVQHPDWPDDLFWRPDAAPGTPDLFRDGFGYPSAPGAIAAALRAFTAPGLTVPWLAAYGNHEGLIQGVGRMTPQLAAALVGGRKPTALPPGIDRDAAYELFVTGAQAFFDGAVFDSPAADVVADPARRPVTRRQFVEAHFGPGARPFGHGFGERNRRDGTAYYCHDLPLPTPHPRYAGVRLVALDTSCLLGGADGALDVEQLRWLEGVLREVHTTHLAADGTPVRGGDVDRLVVLFSHHSLQTLTNDLGSPADGHDSLLGVGPEGHAVPIATAAEVEALVHRYPNVVLWLTGHTHINSVRARRSPHAPAGRPGGFWEVTTCSVMDWPCQTRVVELVELPDDGSGPSLAIACTMVDHDSPLAPGAGWIHPDLAALHRELAANVPIPGYGTVLTGERGDRNVLLPLAQ